MELLQLQYFYDSAKNESFAETAKKYTVPASSVSASVKRLEVELGVELFQRSSNRITLNEKGYLLAQALHETFETLNDAVAQLREKSQEVSHLRMLVKARRKWIADLIIRYREQAPQTVFSISHDATLAEYDQFDVIVDEQTNQYKSMDRFLLSVEQICVKASRHSPLANQALSFRQLKDQAFIVAQRNNRMWSLLESTAKRNGFTPKISIESNDRQCMLRYAEAGMGLILGSRSALKDDLEKELVALNITDFNETQSVYVYYPSTGRKSYALSAFLDFLQKNGVTS